MNMFAETAIADYRSWSADKGEQTFMFRLRLQQTNGSWPFQFSICRKQTEVAVFH
jgi:hypothetical protein